MSFRRLIEDIEKIEIPSEGGSGAKNCHTYGDSTKDCSDGSAPRKRTSRYRMEDISTVPNSVALSN